MICLVTKAMRLFITFFYPTHTPRTVKILLWFFQFNFFPLFLWFHVGSKKKIIFLAKYLSQMVDDYHIPEFIIKMHISLPFISWTTFLAPSSYSEHFNFFSDPFNFHEFDPCDGIFGRYWRNKTFIIRKINVKCMKDGRCKAATLFHTL